MHSQTITIRRYPLTADGKGGVTQGTPATIYSGRAAVDPVSPRDRIFQERRDVETTHHIQIEPVPATLPREEDEVVFGATTMRIVAVANPHELDRTQSRIAHLEIEAVEQPATT